MTPTPDKQILKLLKQWAPDVTNLLDPLTPKGDIAKTISYQRGGKNYDKSL